MRNLIVSAALATAIGVTSAGAEEKLKMATIAPSLGQAITMSTFANIVNDNQDKVEIEVAGGGAATLHMMEVARGNLDFSMVSPTIYAFMKNGKAMYAKQPEAPELSKNVSLLMWFPWGPYHFAVRDGSDITVLDDIEGATVFLGPQGGGAFNAAKGWIAATTGLVAGEDYEAISANWQTGFQAFLDGSIDMYVNGCLDPCQQFIQFTETEKVRFIGPESDQGEAVDKFLGTFRFRADVPAGMYENQTNDGPVPSNDTWVGIGVRTDLDEDTVYEVTRAFWENFDQVTSNAPWAKALNIKDSVQKLGDMPLHPGARRYYEEVGAL